MLHVLSFRSGSSYEEEHKMVSIKWRAWQNNTRDLLLSPRSLQTKAHSVLTDNPAMEFNVILWSLVFRLARNTARKESKGYVKRILVGNPEGKRPLGRPRLRWEDNIKMYIRKIGWWYGLGWSGLRQGPVEVSCDCGHGTAGCIHCSLSRWMQSASVAPIHVSVSCWGQLCLKEIDLRQILTCTEMCSQIQYRQTFTVSSTGCMLDRPPLWSSGQSFWLQIRRPGFDSRHYPQKK
jgi:hypothetical protein